MRLYGHDCIILQPRAVALATLARVNGRPRFVIRKGTAPARANWECARLLARLELAARGLASEEEERAAAAWLVAPPETFRARVSRAGEHVETTMVEDLSAAFAVTQTCTLLRIHEVCESIAPSLAVVTPERVYKKGQQLSWLDDDATRSLARKSNPRSVRKVAIRDEPGRVALLARAC